MFTLGAEILPYHDYPLETSLRELADLGFTHVNLWSSRAPLAHHVNPGDDVADIKRQLRAFGITPTALTMYGKTQDEMRQRIEFAGDLGIDTVDFDYEADYSEFVGSFLPPLLKTCEQVGVRIEVENHLTVPFTEDFEAGGHETERWPEGVDTLAQIKRLVTDIDSRCLGVCLAPPHLWVMNETISEVITITRVEPGLLRMSGEFELAPVVEPDLATRVEIFEEQLQVINGLWCEPAGWSFAGSHYQVEGARFVPPPIQQPRFPIIPGTRRLVS